MGRSLKKGPYIDAKLLERVDELNATRQKKVLKTWARRSAVRPQHRDPTEEVGAIDGTFAEEGAVH